mmetsp:Transcript_4932/g.9608  ORF Transcript_4932/g.9608 Transcript_4932/m.9608 type:complete len:87 (+) Transcript_4932:150-410(+)
MTREVSRIGWVTTVHGFDVNRVPPLKQALEHVDPLEVVNRWLQWGTDCIMVKSNKRFHLLHRRKEQPWISQLDNFSPRYEWNNSLI